MERSRRSFLAAALAGLVGVAGCSDDSGVAYPDETTTSGGATTTATTTVANPTTTTSGEPTTTTSEPSTTSEPTTTTAVLEPALAQETAGILEDLWWYATQYETHVEVYLAHCKQAISTIQKIQLSSTLTENQIRQVEEAANHAADYFDEYLEPYFDVYGPVPDPHFADIRTFAARGDIDRAHEEIGELLQHFEHVSSPTFVAKELSVDPITDRLYSRLSSGSGGDVLFGVRHPTTKYEGWAYPVRPRDYSKYTWAGVNDDARETMTPLLYAPGRTDLASISINQVPGNVRWESDSMPALTVLVQRYGSPSTARSNYDHLVDSVATVEGNTPFGRANWDDVFYYEDGDITYAYTLQVGSFIFSMAPSRTPWNERTDTERDIARLAWLWA